MCWIEVPNHAVSEEVRARLETDPTAIVFSESRNRPARTWAIVVAAFIIGTAVGWLSRF